MSYGVYYLGIDPGAKGGMACILPDGSLDVMKLPEDGDEIPIVEWISKYGYWASGKVARAAIERQTPRPTRWFDKKTKEWQSTVLASTCVLYGSYKSCKMALAAVGVPAANVDDVLPKVWQAGCDVGKRRKEYKDSQWKNHLKDRARELFPYDKRIILNTADAVLLAHYARLMDRQNGADGKAGGVG